MLFSFKKSVCVTPYHLHLNTSAKHFKLSTGRKLITRHINPSLLQCQYRTVSTSCCQYYSQMDCKNMNTDSEAPTAGIIIIGDEILKGRTQDTNGYFIAQRLHKLGVTVPKISIIGDDLASISKEVREFSKLYTHVITTGGIGPTHDDVTFQGVADAFNDRLVANPDIVAFIQDYFKTEERALPAMKMAQIPSSSVLVYGEDKVTGIKSRFPIVCVSNVTVLPGVPQLLEKAFKLLDKRLFGSHRSVRCCDVYLTTDEVTVATAINTTVGAFPHITIGSYPHLYHNYYKTHLTMEGMHLKQVEEARDHFLQQVDPECTLGGYVRDSLSDAWTRLTALLHESSRLQQCVGEAVRVLEQCMLQYKPEEICVCFNGGKDCLVVLHLLYAILHKHNTFTPKSDEQASAKETISETNSLPEYSAEETANATKHKTPGIQTVFITEANSFPQMNQFVMQTINRYELDCSIIDGPLRSALHKLQQEKPAIKVVIMGTRKTDPYSEDLSFFKRTDEDWPNFMRVHPILNWDYDVVWSFIRGLYLPYCTLYDRGYTSLGNANNTTQNPRLLTTDRLGNTTYLPAHLLVDHAQERTGRV